MRQQRFSVMVVRCVCVALSLGLFFSNRADAVRPRADVEQRLRAEGRWDAYAEQLVQAHRRGLDQANPSLLAGTAGPIAGTLRTIVILVDFSDNPYTSNSNTLPSYFDSLLFSTNDPKSSLTDYYLENSYGQTLVQGDVVGWLRMDSTYAYYVAGARGTNLSPPNARLLARDAALKADGIGVDFAQYDSDNNGFVDGFFVVHAGPGFEETGNDNHIHSHKWTLISTLNLDGKFVSAYTMQPEEQGDFTKVNIGVFCHEFGHFLGLPDLYDTDFSSQGLDEWALMAAGNYSKQDGSSPSHFCAWSKIQLGWVTPVQPVSNMTSVVIPQIEYNSVAYQLWTNGAGGTEYFLVENRQRSGFDRFLPGGGLLIYHVDDAVGGQAPNNNEWYPGQNPLFHYKVALEQADGRFELETSPGTGSLSADGGDPYPGNTLATAFDDLTVPDSRGYSGLSSQVAVWNISAPGSTMTANLDVVFSRPLFGLEGFTFTDNENSNGAPDPGEQVDMYVTYVNHWLGVGDAQLTLSTDDTTINFVSNSIALGVVGTGDTATNAAPITFDVPAGKPSRITDFYITITAQAGGYVITDTVRVFVGAPQILVVDDDNRIQRSASYDTAFYFPVLDERRFPYDSWEVFSQGAPTTMANYPIVLWYTGDRRPEIVGEADSILTVGDISAIKSYLDGGGNLLLTGQQIAFFLDSIDTAFMNNYLMCAYGGPSNDFLVTGVSGDVITDSTGFVLGGSGGAQNQTAKDLVIPLRSAITIMTDTLGTNIMGIRIDTTYNLVFLSFGIEAIGDDIDFPDFEENPKADLINRVIDWFLDIASDIGDDELPTLPESFKLKANYPNPFNPSTTIAFTVGTKPAFARLVIYNLLGRKVRALVDGYFTPGEYRYTWDGRDDKGVEMGSGIYFYRLSIGGDSRTRKMLMLK